MQIDWGWAVLAFMGGCFVGAVAWMFIMKAMGEAIDDVYGKKRKGI